MDPEQVLVLAEELLSTPLPRGATLDRGHHAESQRVHAATHKSENAKKTWLDTSFC